jgi:hypothetical protein
MPLPFERIDDSTFVVRDSEVTAGWERWYLLKADTHWDNPHCDRRLLERLHQQARERDAAILEIGDLFCLMGGKWDPRSDKSGVRPEHQVADYLGAVEDTAVAAFEPYADLYRLITHGNHDTAILRRHEYDILGRFCRRLGIQEGAYSGHVLFRFEGATGGNRSTRILHWHHGWGGGGPVTKGTLNPVKVAATQPDADIVCYGHIHEQWLFTVTRERTTSHGRKYLSKQWHVQLPTLKNEYTGNGYHVEKGRPPKPLGAWWLRFYHAPSAPGRVAFELRMSEE